MTTPDRDRRVQWIHSSQPNEEWECYDAGSAEEDADPFSFGDVIPGIIAGLLARYESERGLILDPGAHTGIMGELLGHLGYKDLVAIDLSQGALNVAESRGAYKSLHQMVMGEHLDFPDDNFQAVVACGVLGDVHAPPSSFDELLRITRPGGHVIFSVRADVYLSGGFKEVMDGHAASGRWTMAEMTEPFKSLPVGEPDVRHQVFAYRVS